MRRKHSKLHFIADVMLGRLTRWLRRLGFPTDYEDHAEDDALLKTAMKTDAVLLTRDRALAKKARDFCPVVLVRANDFPKQFQEVAIELNLKIPKTFSTVICSPCGHDLKKIPKASIQAEVRPRVYQRQRAFWQCQNPQCRKIYWKGTHAKKIQKTIQKLLQIQKSKPLNPRRGSVLAR